MVESMRAELAELAARLEREKKVRLMLQSLQSKERELTNRAQELKVILEREEADVTRLEKPSVASIFYAIAGKKGEKLDKEQQEAYAARLKYDAAARQLDDCRAHREELQRELTSLSGTQAQYDRTFARLKLVLQADPAYADRLCALERRRGEAIGQLKELGEALSAGSAVMNQIDSIRDNLGSAESWGTWDLLGGGLLADISKHSHLDEAQNGAEHLQVLLSRFHSELADVHIDPNMGAVNVDGFLRFADYFFDGLIADWSVLSRIRDSQESVETVRAQVSDTMSKLSALKAARAAEKAEVERQTAELLTNV